MAMTLRLDDAMDEMLKVVCLIDEDTGAGAVHKALDLYFRTRMKDPAFKNKLDIKLLQMKEAIKPFSEMLEVIDKPETHEEYEASGHTRSIPNRSMEHNHWCEKHHNWEE